MEGSKLAATVTLTELPATCTSFAGRVTVDVAFPWTLSKETVPTIPPGPVATVTVELKVIA